MSRVFTDEGLLTWEAYASGGKFGLPERPKVIFNCISHPGQRARYVVLPGDEADAQQAMLELTDGHLRDMLGSARELD